ncbi:IS4 family transposase, partial [Shewanella xiamenensis]
MIKWFRQKLHLDNKMREANILQHSLHQYCPELHLKRLNSLMLASKALIECKT